MWVEIDCDVGEEGNEDTDVRQIGEKRVEVTFM